MQRGAGGGCSTEEGPKQKPPVTDIVQNGCLNESRLAAGHWAKETMGSARGVLLILPTILSLHPDRKTLSFKI